MRHNNHVLLKDRSFHTPKWLSSKPVMLMFSRSHVIWIRAPSESSPRTTRFPTQRTHIYTQTQPNGSVLFLDATARLGFNSRRLYDILHVLDGAGLITIERTKFHSTITWTGKCGGTNKKPQNKHRPPPIHQHPNVIQNRKLDEELIKLDAWLQILAQPHHMSEQQEQHDSVKCRNITTTTTSHTATVDQANLYITKNDLWQQRKGSGGVDLILASQPGSVLQLPTQRTATPPSSSIATPTTYSFQLVPPPQPVQTECDTVSSSPVMAYFLEDTGVLKPLELGVPPPPLFASCCSDFTLVHLEAAACVSSDTLSQQ